MEWVEYFVCFPQQSIFFNLPFFWMEDGILHQTEGWPLGIVKLSFSEVGLPFVGMVKKYFACFPQQSKKNLNSLFLDRRRDPSPNRRLTIGSDQLLFSEVGLPLLSRDYIKIFFEDVKLRKILSWYCICNSLITPD